MVADRIPTKLYPFEGHYLQRDGIRQHYLDEGSGETLVMLHGNPTWSFYYRDLVLALRDRYRTIVPDHIGCGLSDKPEDSRYEYSLRRRVDDVEALLDHLGLRKDITLILHDWGGMIGMAYAVRHPERVRRLVILNTAAFRMPSSKRLPWQLKLFRSPLGPLLAQGLNSFAKGAVRSCMRRKTMSEAVRQGYLAPYDSWRHRIALLRFVQDIPLDSGHRSYPIIGEVESQLHLFGRLPIWIGWGEDDFVFDRHFLQAWIRLFPEAEVHRVPDAGHYVLEDAGDEIIPLIDDFLQRHPLNG